jgi:hypothetical protein
MLKAISQVFYGDTTRWFIGKVVDNNDPLTLGRVRVHIIGIHDGIAEQGDLPWASVVLPTTEGGLVTGFPPSLDLGAQVFGIFLDGIQSQLPLVIGSIPHKLPDYGALEAGSGVVYNSQDFISQQAGQYTGELEPVGSANESSELAYSYFRGVGYSDAQARGIVGNLIVESINFKPSVIRFDQLGDLNTAYAAYGIAQWRAERKDQLLKQASLWGSDPRNLSTQLRFVHWELTNTEAKAGAELAKCSLPDHAAIVFMRKYERPAKTGNISPYREPPYSSTGSFPAQRAGESERVNYAKNLVFNSRPVTNNGPQ